MDGNFKSLMVGLLGGTILGFSASIWMSILQEPFTGRGGDIDSVSTHYQQQDGSFTCLVVVRNATVEQTAEIVSKIPERCK